MVGVLLDLRETIGLGPEQLFADDAAYLSGREQKSR
jgi:hypothetical protein